MAIRRPTAPKRAFATKPHTTTSAKSKAATTGPATTKPATTSGPATTKAATTKSTTATKPKPAKPRSTSGAMRKATRAVVPGWRLPVMRPLTAIGITVAVVTLLLGPYAQPSWSQRSQLNTTQQQVDDLQHQVDQLVAERARWNDPNYVRTQARGRLRYVMPGETGYVLLDDAGVALSTSPHQSGAVPGGAVPGGAVPGGAAGQAWYTTVWQSLQAAGTGAPPSPAGAVTSATP